MSRLACDSDMLRSARSKEEYGFNGSKGNLGWSEGHIEDQAS